MSETSQDRLYNLMPDLYRWRDKGVGESLRMFLSVVESELLTIEADMAAQHNNWFIQTCDRWTIPYIAELLGIRHDSLQAEQLPFSQRRLIANTLAYRRRKGTLVVLEQVAWDVTNWHTHAVEFQPLLATTQHLRHLRPNKSQMTNLRQPAWVNDVNGPFSTLAHTIDLRKTRLPETVSSTPNQEKQVERERHRSGKYNRNQIGLFLWRLKSYPVKKSYANSVSDHDSHAGCFHFSRNGDIPLFNSPEPFAAITQLATAVNMPIRLTRAEFAADLDEYRQTAAIERTANSKYYGPDRGLNIWRNGKLIPPSRVISIALNNWPDLSKIANLDRQTNDDEKIEVAIDVELGRMVFRTDPTDSGDSVCREIVTDYTYGFSGEIGGGPYLRNLQLDNLEELPFRIQVASGGIRPNSVEGRQLNDSFYSDKLNLDLAIVDSLEFALTCWNSYCENSKHLCKGVIWIMDNGLYQLPALSLATGAELTIIAHDGVQPTIRNNPQQSIRLDLDGENLRKIDDKQTLFGQRLRLNGLRFESTIRINTNSNPAGEPFALEIDHCTLMHSNWSLKTSSPGKGSWLTVRINNSIVGPIQMAAIDELLIFDSIVDQKGNGSKKQKAIDGSKLSVACSTIFGAVDVQQLCASTTIFSDPTHVANSKESVAAYSYLSVDSNVAHRDDSPPADQPPTFTSQRYGQPGYAQLDGDSPDVIKAGAENGSELGVFHHLAQPQRQRNLVSMLDEYLPVGFLVGTFYVT